MHNPDHYLTAVLKTLKDIHDECARQPTIATSVKDLLVNLHNEVNVREIRYRYFYILNDLNSLHITSMEIWSMSEKPLHHY